jgi:hypothetical protein
MSWQLDDGKEKNTPHFFFVDARRLPKHHSFALIVVLDNGSIDYCANLAVTSLQFDEQAICLFICFERMQLLTRDSSRSLPRFNSQHDTACDTIMC